MQDWLNVGILQLLFFSLGPLQNFLCVLCCVEILTVLQCKSALSNPRCMTTLLYVSHSVFRKNWRRPFRIDSLWLWPVRDVVFALPFHLAGTIHSMALRVVLGAIGVHHGVAAATNGRLALGMAKKHQLKGKVNVPWSRKHRFCIYPS